MKCPRCGSENLWIPGPGYGSEQCRDCGYFWNKDQQSSIERLEAALREIGELCDKADPITPTSFRVAAIAKRRWESWLKDSNYLKADIPEYEITHICVGCVEKDKRIGSLERELGTVRAELKAARERLQDAEDLLNKAWTLFHTTKGYRDTFRPEWDDHYEKWLREGKGKE